MKIISTPNIYNNNQSNSPNFKNKDYFLKIKQLPGITCGCCGKEVLRVDEYIKNITPLSKPLSYILSRGKLDYVQKYYPEAWKTLIGFATKYPEQTLDEIVESQENYVKLKVNIAERLEDPSIEENTKERNYLDRRIGGRFFDLLARSRCMMKNSSTIIENIIPLKSYLDGTKKEAFELLEHYSKIYPDKTLREIVKEVHTIHEKRNVEYKQNKLIEINQRFSNIKNLTKEKATRMSEIIDSLEEKSWEILKKEKDPACRKYKIKNLYIENFKKYGYDNIHPEILKEIESIPVILVNADTFFAHAYKNNFSDEKILRTIFDPITGSEEHIEFVSDNGADRIGNKTVFCKECNDLRKVPYHIFVEYHPEILENSQKQIDIITNSLKNEELTEDYRFYPYTIAQKYKQESQGKINLNLIQYSKEMLKRSKQKLAEFEKEIENLTEKRDNIIVIIQKKPELKTELTKEVESINKEIQALRDKIWSERNLQSIIHNYLNERKV